MYLLFLLSILLNTALLLVSLNDADQRLHILQLLRSFWGLCVQELQDMLGCGCQFVQMFECQVLPGGLLERHCRLSLFSPRFSVK